MIASRNAKWGEYMDIGPRIKSLREKKNLAQFELATILKISNSTLSQYETGARTPSDDIKIAIANYFDVSVDYLLGRDTIEKTPVSKGGRWIPVLGSVPAGIPIEAVEDILDWEEIPASMCSGDREYFALQVRGDSMWPD